VFSVYLQRDSEAIAETRCLDIARRWITACSKGNCYFLVQELADRGDEELADLCIKKWRLDEPLGDNDLTWFEQNQADREMLMKAFAATRAYFGVSS